MSAARKKAAAAMTSAEKDASGEAGGGPAGAIRGADAVVSVRNPLAGSHAASRGATGSSSGRHSGRRDPPSPSSSTSSIVSTPTPPPSRRLTSTARQGASLSGARWGGAGERFSRASGGSPSAAGVGLGGDVTLPSSSLYTLPSSVQRSGKGSWGESGGGSRFSPPSFVPEAEEELEEEDRRDPWAKLVDANHSRPGGGGASRAAASAQRIGSGLRSPPPPRAGSRGVSRWDGGGLSPPEPHSTVLPSASYSSDGRARFSATPSRVGGGAGSQASLAPSAPRYVSGGLPHMAQRFSMANPLRSGREGREGGGGDAWGGEGGGGGSGARLLRRNASMSGRRR